jgi:glycosyltransferase involved in cell wall biosynthesis
MGSKIDNRRQCLLRHVSLAGTGLELGARAAPTLRRTEANILYGDYPADTRATDPAGGPSDADDAPSLDYVITSDSYESITGAFDYIIANNILEQVANVIAWFARLHELLKPEGILFLAVADKKYGADHFRADTEVSHIIGDYLADGGDLAAEHLMETVVDEDVRYAGQPLLAEQRLDRQRIERDFSQGSRVGLHCHVFQAETFLARILNPLIHMGYLDFSLLEFQDTMGNHGEFFVVLRKGAPAVLPDISGFFSPVAWQPSRPQQQAPTALTSPAASAPSVGLDAPAGEIIGASSRETQVPGMHEQLIARLLREAGSQTGPLSSIERELAEQLALQGDIAGRDRSIGLAREQLHAAQQEIARHRQALQAQLDLQDQACKQAEERLRTAQADLQQSAEWRLQVQQRATALQQMVADIRVSRRYKIGNILSAFKQRPWHSAGVALKWSLGVYSRRGQGMAGALEAPDPLQWAQQALAGGLQDRGGTIAAQPSSAAGAAPSPPEPTYDPYAYLEPLKGITVVVEDRECPSPTFPLAFSVITTVKNEAGNILAFLKSIETQDVRPSELVVVDGGSSDDTVRLIEGFAETSRVPVRLFVEPGANIARGRNMAIHHAGNNIIVSLDAGCHVQPGLLRNLVGCFYLHPDADLVSGIFYDRSDKSSAEHLIPDWDNVDWFRLLPSARNIAFRKTLSLQTGGFPEDLSLTGEDTLFDINYRRASTKWVFSRKAVVKWHAPQNHDEALRLGFRYGVGDGESGFGDFRFYRTRSEHRRGRPVNRQSVWGSSFFGYLAGCKGRANVEIERRHIQGLVIILSGVPITDSGGGQRGAQLALEFIHQGYKVIYVNVYPSYEAPHRIFFDVDYSLLELYHIDDFDMAETLRRYQSLTAPAMVLLEFPHPRFMPLVRMARSSPLRPGIAYDYIDNWDTTLGGDWYSREMEKQIIADADLLVASAGTLMESFRRKTDRPIHLVPNAVNLRVFDAGRQYPRPADLPDGRPIVMYVGALWGQWFDWSILEEAARSLSDTWIALIGNINDAHKANIEARMPNVRCLGLKQQRELPGYLAHSAVCIIPFKSDDITRYVNPLKVYEYLAMDRPVVATGLAELRNMPGVALASSGQEFVDAIRRFLQDPPPPGTCRRYAESQSWTHRVGDILRIAKDAQGRCE